MHLLINELAKLTNTNVETIRGYRKKGLLHPVQNPENKYYYYTDQDIFKLFQIRVMRQNNVSIRSVQSFMNNDDPVRILEESLKQKKEEILQLEKDIDALEHRLSVVKDCIENSGKVIINTYHRTKYDIPLIYTMEHDEKVYKAWLDHIEYTPLSLHIDKELLSTKNQDSRIPYTITLGTYGDFLENLRLPLPQKYYYTPGGQYLCLIIKVSAYERITYEHIRPLIVYAEEHQLEFSTDVTAYLFHTMQECETVYNYYRIRIGIKEASAQ